MARPALSADRALEILDVLTGNAARRFTLSELVQLTGVNASSMHSLLAVLERRGWIERHPTHRTYGLGPLPIATGAVAAHQHLTLDSARDQLSGLSERIEAEVILTVQLGDEMVVIDRAGATAPYGPPLYPGLRIPLAAPVGAVYVAWAGDEAAERWLSRAGAAMTRAQAAEQRRLLGGVRDRGYALALDCPAYRRFSDSMVGNTSPAEDLGDLLGALVRSPYNAESPESDEPLDVAIIAAPVFDEFGRVAAAVSASGFAPGQTAMAVRRAAQEVRGVATIATKCARGSYPLPKDPVLKEAT